MLRHRHQRLMGSIEHYEGLVDEQQSQLNQLNRPRDIDSDEEDETMPADDEDARPPELFLSEEDVQKEEEEIRELERKKVMLEERVSSLGKDITGVLR
jgi:hypothetical protein